MMYTVATAQTETASPMRTFAPERRVLVQRKCACAGSSGMAGACEECSNERLNVQRRPVSEAQPLSVPPSVHEVLRSPGQPLDPAARSFMEPRFGHDFAKVRVHTDAQAIQSAREVHAHAYTVGNDVVFAEGQYAPASPEGRRLLAHELNHVVQQGKATSVSAGISQPGDAQEKESDHAADSILNGDVLSGTSLTASIPQLQRSPDSSSSSDGSSSSSSDSSRSSSGGPPDGGAAWPTPTPNPAGGCQCRFDICWRPIQLWYVPSYYKHGFINIIDSSCRLHNLYVDPGQHGGHSHAVDNTPGWDTSGQRCLTFPNYPCSLVDGLAPATARYEALDVSYDATSGPNSNSFLEWILDAAGITGIPAPHGGLMAWDYYVSNPSRRSSPPRFRRAPAAAPAAPPAAPAPATP